MHVLLVGWLHTTLYQYVADTRGLPLPVPIPALAADPPTFGSFLHNTAHGTCFTQPILSCGTLFVDAPGSIIVPTPLNDLDLDLQPPKRQNPKVYSPFQLFLPSPPSIPPRETHFSPSLISSFRCYCVRIQFPQERKSARQAVLYPVSTAGLKSCLLSGCPLARRTHL